ncbi:MAG: DUF3667 domain-containing protein [Paludibacteraceae bacterium]|nr:DUF3667 domain-containing protein [Paludibacteraceae bacterium]MBQ8714976.1 DUF3667 domain-containing protein [Prevotella sp.]
MIHIKEKWRAFCEWQRQPYQVAAKSPELHCCRTCGEEFMGNYCPRCGQSYRIGRYSFKNAMLLFLDVWGLGNRGMFRTLRDLLLRPGYMIRDYISGMQMAYFPPFKLLFLLTALQLAVSSGFNLKDLNFWGTATEQSVEETVAPVATDKVKDKVKDEVDKAEPDEKSFQYAGRWLGKKAEEFGDKYRNLLVLITLLGMSIFIYFFVRKSPNISDLRFSELLVAQVYTWNMMSIYNIVLIFLGIGLDRRILILLPIISLKQLTGFSWWRTILAVAVSYLLFLIFAFVVVFVVGYYVFGVLD